MNEKTAEFFVDCEAAIQGAYEQGVTMEMAERLAAKFLHAGLKVGAELRDADLDARMKKTGLKAIKASVYMKNAEPKLGEKRPTVDALEAMVNQDAHVTKAQNELDEAEVWRDTLVNYLNIFREGHIYFRGIAKGNFNG